MVRGNNSVSSVSLPHNFVVERHQTAFFQILLLLHILFVPLFFFFFLFYDRQLAVNSVVLSSGTHVQEVS